MRCKEIVKGEAGYLCGDITGLYACERCDENSKECQNCVAIPLPAKPTQYRGIGYGETQQTQQGIMDTITSYVFDQKFLVGVGVGLLAGMLLFRK